MDRGAHGCLLDPDRALPARARNGGEPLYSKGGFALSLRTFVVAVLLCGDAPRAAIRRSARQMARSLLRNPSRTGARSPRCDNRSHSLTPRVGCCPISVEPRRPTAQTVGRATLETSFSGERVERRLAAIIAADVAGYSRLIGLDEIGTLARLRAHRRELIDPRVAEHKGRIVKTTGDGMLVEFGSVVEAVACALAVQQGMAERNSGTPEDQQITLRIGINVGDVVVENDDIFGDGVNVAARLEALAEPGGICVSARVQEDAFGRLDVTFDDLGETPLKNINRPVRVYRIRLSPTGIALKAAPTETAVLTLPGKPSIAVLPFQNMSGDPEQDYFVDGTVEEIITACRASAGSS